MTRGTLIAWNAYELPAMPLRDVSWLLQACRYFPCQLVFVSVRGCGGDIQERCKQWWTCAGEMRGRPRTVCQLDYCKLLPYYSVNRPLFMLRSWDHMH